MGHQHEPRGPGRPGGVSSKPATAFHLAFVSFSFLSFQSFTKRWRLFDHTRSLGLHADIYLICLLLVKRGPRRGNGIFIITAVKHREKSKLLILFIILSTKYDFLFSFFLNEWGVFEPFSRLALYFQGHEETNSYKPITVLFRQSSVLRVFGGE